jgi:hypothetical protein
MKASSCVLSPISARATLRPTLTLPLPLALTHIARNASGLMLSVLPKVKVNNAI